MYRIYYDDKVVHDPYSPNELAFNVTCFGGLNDKGNMILSVAPNHPLYNKFKLRNGLIIFKNDDIVIFVGFIEKIETDMDLVKEISCVGDMAYLGDIILRPYTTGYEKGMIHIDPSPEALFKWYIDEYNERAMYQFVIGKDDFPIFDDENTFERTNRDYSTVGKEIETQLLGTLGGFLNVRHDGGVSYIDYSRDLASVNSQIIDFGVNLLDYLRTESVDELYTAVVPTGVIDEETGLPLTLEGYVLEGEIHDGYFRQYEDSIINTQLTDKYGYREINYNNTDCTTQRSLYDAGLAYLKSLADPSKQIICKAIDLSLFMEGYKHLTVGQIVRVRSKPHGVDQYMVVTEIDIDLDNPENTEYTLGIIYDTLTGEQSAKLVSMNASMNKSADKIANLDKDIQETAKDAAQTKEELEGLIERFESTETDRSEFEKQIRESLKSLKDIADGAIETWFYPGPPQLNTLPTSNWNTEDEKHVHIGDLYYDTKTGYAYRWMYEPNAQGEMRYAWGRIMDTDVQAALEIASKAKDTADSKRRVFYETPFTPYDEGDLWAQGSSGDILVSTVDRPTGKFEASDWVYAAKYSKAVYSTEEQFYQSDSPEELVGGEWSLVNTWVEGKYTWRRTLVTYGDGDYEYTPSEKGVCITGNTGEPGEPGVGVLKVDVQYYLSSSSNQLSDGQWQTNPPGWYPGKFMWTKTIILYSDGKTVETSPVCIALSGSDGVGIEKIVEEYNQSPSNTSPVDGKWTTFYPGWKEGTYIWTRSTIYYTDGSKETTTPVCVTGSPGKDGENGQDGVGIKSITEYYLVTNKSSNVATNESGWTTDIPTMTATNRYLWNYKKTLFTNGKEESTKPVIIGVYGSKGEDGKDGTAISGSSSTEAGVAKKVATVSGAFSLVDGVCVSIYFTHKNTASEPTLNVNSSGDKKIMTNGVNEGYWDDKQTVIFVYYKSEDAWYVASHPVWGTKATIGNPSQNNIYLDGTNLDFRTGSTVNSRFTNGTIELGRNLSSSIIKMCGNNGYIDYSDTQFTNSQINSLNVYTANKSNPVYLQAGPLRSAKGYYGSYIRIAGDNINAGVPNNDGIYQCGMTIYSYSSQLNGNGSYISTSNSDNTLYCSNGGNYIYAPYGNNIFYSGGIYKGSTLYSVYAGRTIYTGDTTANITLSEDVSNFAMIEIFYRDNVSNRGSVKVYNGYSTATASLLTTRYDSSSLYFNHREVSMSGNNINTVYSSNMYRYGRFMIKSTGTTYSNDNNLYITRVIGWK